MKKKIQKTNAMRQLETADVNYQVHTHEWSEQKSDVQFEVPLDKIYKTLVAVGNNTGEIVACIPAAAELDLKKLAHESGNKKVDMLHMKELERVTGYMRGGCSPIGMKRSFPTFIAAEAKGMASIVVSAGKRGMQMELTPEDLAEMTQGKFVGIIEQ